MKQLKPGKTPGKIKGKKKTFKASDTNNLPLSDFKFYDIKTSLPELSILKSRKWDLGKNAFTQISCRAFVSSCS